MNPLEHKKKQHKILLDFVNLICLTQSDWQQRRVHMMAANQDLIGEEEQSLQLNKDAAVSKLATTDGDNVEIKERSLFTSTGW